MAKKHGTIPISIIDVVDYYQMFIQHEMDNQLNFYKDYLVKNKMWGIASNTLLGGSHLYRLVKAYPTIRQNAVNDIIKHKLYDPTQLFTSFCCLHKCVETIIHRPHVGAVAIYDVSKFVGYSLKKQVLPCNDVYIHTVVINGLKFLANKGYVNITQMQKVPNILCCWTIPLTAFDLQLQKLDSLHLEDLLCAIGHNCNRKGNLKPTNVYSLDSIPKAIDHCFYEILKNL